jgi:DNA topoisomerase-2
LKHGFVEEFITPIVKVTKRNVEKSFYSMPEFEEWQNQNADDWHTYKIKVHIFFTSDGESLDEIGEIFTDGK